MERNTVGRHGSGRSQVSGALRGAFRSVLLGWTDPVSGERLTVRMRGEDGLLASLTPLGFEELVGEEEGCRAEGRGRVLSFRAQRPARGRALRSAKAPRPGHPEGPAAAG